MTRSARKGLTIIELMIVFAIIGILATVAVSAWRDHRVRDKVREAVNLAHPARTALGIACSKGELAGADNRSLGLPPPSAHSVEHTRSIAAVGLDATEGTVTITLGSISGVIAEGGEIVYTGVCGADGMRWTVGGTVPPEYVPREPGSSGG